MFLIILKYCKANKQTKETHFQTVSNARSVEKNVIDKSLWPNP